MKKQKILKKFDSLEMLELEHKGCDFVTPFQGSKGNISFQIDKKKGIVIDTYIISKDKIRSIQTEEGVSFDQLIDKLSE